MKARRFDYYPDDFLVGTRGMSDAEVGLYWRACSLMYSHGGPVEVAELQRWSGCRGGNFKLLLHKLIATDKLQLKAGLIDSRRVADELLKAGRRVAKAVLNGSRGGRPSKNTNGIENPELPSRAQQASSIKQHEAPNGASPPLETPPSKATRLAADWAPDEACRQYAIGKGLDPDATAEAFRDYWHAKPRDDTKRDWCATWRNWCRRQRQFPHPQGVNGHARQRQSPVEKLYAGAFAAAQDWDRSHGDSGSGEPSALPLLDR